jgi:hypothetical protein
MRKIYVNHLLSSKLKCRAIALTLSCFAFVFGLIPVKSFGQADPSVFTAMTYNNSQINLTATASDNIVVVYNLTGTFGAPTPATAPTAVGTVLAGSSGTIVYVGLASGLGNHTGLTPNTHYFYKAFSYNMSYNYSTGVAKDATTCSSMFNVTGGGSYCSGGSGVTISLSSSESGVSYQLKNGGSNVGSAVAGTGAALNFNSNTAAGTYTIDATNSAGSCTVTMSGNAVVKVTQSVTPSVTIVANTLTTICAGTSVTFTATPGNGGTTPAYQWQSSTDGGTNWGNIAGENTSTYTSNSFTAPGIRIRVLMTPDPASIPCPSPAIATSNVILMAVNNPVTPSVSIAATAPLYTLTPVICPSTSVTFTATPTNGGVNPLYQWYINGTPVGSNTTDATFTTSSLTNGNKITVVITSKADCALPLTAISNEIPVTVNPAIPAAPVANGGSGAACTQITANWAASTNATAYFLDVSTDNGFGSLVGIYNNLNVGNVTTINVTGLLAGTTYYYRVRASNICGISANSGTITYATLAATPAAPVVAAGSCAECKQITANWAASANATTYFLDISTDNGFGIFVGTYNNLNVGNVTTLNVTGLTAGVTYYYRVRASNTCGTSANSGTTTYATLAAAPAAPVVAAGSGAACTQITANWAASTNGTTYFLDVSTDNGFGSFVGTYNNRNVGSVTTMNVTGLTAGVTYYYRVRASNTCGTSANSGTTTYATLAATPATPSAITGNTSVCSTSTGISYSVTKDPTATYNWTLPSGWSIASGSGTNSITVNPSSTSGNISVTASNYCGTSNPQTLSVSTSTGIPANPGVITGQTSICTVGTTYTYSLSSVSGATSYVWSLPASYGTISGSSTGSSIDVNVPGTVTKTGYTISVQAQNGCGLSSSNSSSLVTVGNYAYVKAMDDFTICATDKSQILLTSITGGATGSSNITWSATPTGGIYNQNPNKPWFYTPSNAAISNGSVTLTVTTDKPSGCSAVTDQLVITIRPTATASISGATTICSGASTNITFTATPNTIVSYNINGVNNQTINIGASGSATSATGALNSTTTYNLVNLVYASGPSCGQTFSGKSATVTVNALPTITGTLNVCAGTTTQLTGSGTAAASNPWTSASTGVATVSTTGLVTGVAAGTSVITYTNSNGCSITATVTVNVLPTITGTLNVCAGTTTQLTGSVTAAASNPWTSASTGVATVSTTGLVTGVAAGTSVITYTNSNGCSITATVTVNALPTITGTLNVCAGTTTQLTGLGTAAASNPWTSASTGVATVSPTGLVAGVASGTSVITYTNNNGCNVTETVTVTTAATVSAGPSQTICSNSTAIMAASFGGGASSATWSSSGDGIFNNNNTNAIYTPGAADIYNGTVTLTFTTNDPAGPCGPVNSTLTLTILKAVAISTQPTNVSICESNVADLAVVASGAASYQWYKGTAPGGSIVNNSGTISGAQSKDLHFSSASLGDDGNYYVIINGAAPCAAVTSSAVSLNVNKGITISTQPVSKLLCQGSNVTFSVIADANGETLGYQWYKGASIITGATSSAYSINGATPTDNGNYYVIISGPSGYMCSTATSATASLVITPTVTIAAFSPATSTR